MRQLVLALVSLGVFLNAGELAGQAVTDPPAAASITGPSQARPFFTRTAKSELVVLAMAETVDATATQYALAHGHTETNPIARPLVVHGSAGQAVACATGFAAVLGVSYALHRAGHPRAAVIVRRVCLAGELFAAGYTFTKAH